MTSYKLSLAGIALLFSISSFAQESESLSLEIDHVTYNWDLYADSLNSYEGLNKFCNDVNFRTEIIDVLNGIHHFDSVLYGKLKAAYRYNKDKEIEKTLKEISEFESDYSMKLFLNFLRSECTTVKDLEKHKEELKKDVGENSYDGQIYILETELNKFVKHITKRVDNLRDHVHHLKIN